MVVRWSERSKGSCFSYAPTSRPSRRLKKRVAFNGALLQSAWHAPSGVTCHTCSIPLAPRSFHSMAEGMACETRTVRSAEQSTAAAKQAQRCSTLRPVFGQSRGARECDRTPEPLLLCRGRFPKRSQTSSRHAHCTFTCTHMRSVERHKDARHMRGTSSRKARTAPV